MVAEQTHQHTHQEHKVAVTVRFALSRQSPYHGDFAQETLVGTVRDRAMHALGVTPDPQYVYYLTHNRTKVDDTKRLSDVAGSAKAIEFGLAKELLQG